VLWFALSEKRTATPAHSIAVMPFINRSGDAGQDAIVDGITASLNQQFERESGIRVVGRISTSRFTSANYDVAQLKQRLGVDTILTGSVEKRGATLRLRVRLADRPDAAPVWSGSYTFDSEFHEAIEYEIAAEVLHVLRTGKPGPRSQPAFRAKVAPEAWSAYLQGLHFQSKIDTAGLNRAIERFENAVKHDSSFARAYAALATSWVLAAQVSAIPPAEVSGRIRHFASRALQLDGTLGDPHFSLAVCAQYEFDWAAAEQEFRTGLALSPSSSLGHFWYAKYLALTGRHREVLVHRTIGAELDPLSPYAIQSVAGYWSVMGEYRQAINGFRSALALDPNFGLARQGLGISYLLDGQLDKAIAELESAASIQRGLRTQSLLGYAYGVAGRQNEARAMLADFEERERRGPFPALAIAHIYLGLGDKNRAFEWLEKAVDQRDLSATLQWDSLYAPLRSDQRYSGLLRRMRLA
jgi:TolB-like protein/Tfp pilus assembly protein PilF